ncbi:MAG: hypothetical protein UR18_C0006G0025 [Candidatus Nomurabacteria bacterium GW2011_GWE2_31_40]|nr:MAG: hypothetical protein UR18_C0006G0025 [Candidatus Nomurabacteria bacterium GW2011_GWE2_31_40]OGV06199.1 MAG: hypothetical protein A2299_12235 [Stygiobacter sp. RIFOXYB2_FULL_37_11]OGV15949.1 MAG: hypothetical protein A2440_03165 [Stygiobacter sp. RIFOXYC2_FULL_38_25]OGV27893.1 MAG: hypothetical protein A2499_17270 [Stygiobacter sp. RIFOXYC12_FULL_38_8]OGV80426.1 MAG: hypothetical protein A2X65_04325 [Stygiobacter sp. GWF2_38_21]
MKKVLLLLWQLPQSIIGFICVAFWCIVTSEYYYVTLNGTAIFLFDKFPSWIWGISFGTIAGVEKVKYTSSGIKTNIVSWETVTNIMGHELGYATQSKILGPVYLIAILLQHVTIWIPYEKRFMEAWANKIGIKVTCGYNGKAFKIVN